MLYEIIIVDIPRNIIPTAVEHNAIDTVNNTIANSEQYMLSNVSSI